MACTVSEDTRVDVAKFLSGRSTFWLYLATSMRPQDHPHPIAGRALPPTRWLRVASRKCEEPFQGDVNPISSGSTLRGWFSGYSLVRLSQTTIVAVLHCKLTNWLAVKTCTRKMNNEARSTLPGPLVPPGRRGVPNRQTTVGNASGGRDGGVDGPPVAGGSSGDRRGERGENQRSADVQYENSSKYCVKYCEVQHCVVLRRGGRSRQFRWFILAP